MGGRLLEGPTMVGRTSDWKEELGRFLKPFLDRLGLVAFHVERLIAKEQDLMLRQRLVQLLDLAVAERLGERQAVDLGANARRGCCSTRKACWVQLFPLPFGHS